MRHLKNINELILYASVSCGAAFIGRIFPPFYFPILLLRLGIFSYCAYVIARLEGNRETALILGGAIFIGMLGSYWDLIEVWLRYDLASITRIFTLVLLFLIAIAGLYIHFRSMRNGDTSKK